MASFESLNRVGVVGLMSGTSLDGLDLCFVEFNRINTGWSFEIKATKGLNYSEEWRVKLEKGFKSNKRQLDLLDREFGTFLGEQTQQFIGENNLENAVDLIASHGHTIFHEPHKGITVQIGDGANLAAVVQKPVVNNFRIKDVELGGQGAPLVPIGDRDLFGDYDACLNLGGIANISYTDSGERVAYDISPCNLPLNKFMRSHFNRDYDQGGEIAATGEIIPELLRQLDALDFYDKKPPKSLGVEWLNVSFYPILNRYVSINQPINAILKTVVEHETNQIARVCQQENLKNLLITGGGAFNTFFIQQLKAKTSTQIRLPSHEIIEFKEALVFGYLGLLRVLGRENTLRSVTGARQNSSGGILHLPH